MMGFTNLVIHHLGIVVNELLRPLGIQVLKIGQLEELKSFEIPAIAGMMRLPEVFIETGTYLDHTTARAARHFREVHTVELDKKLYEKAQGRFREVKNVTCHHGNSPDVLRDLLPTIKEPVLFFLDAHWSGGVTGRGEIEVPLLEELELINRRGYEDLIVIDDLRLVGKSGTTGLRFSREYPLSTFDWRDVTMDAIKEALGKSMSIKECKDKLLVDTQNRTLKSPPG